MTDLVLDNSVAMRWCFDKGSRPYADSLLRRLATGADRAFVPILWRYEASAVLARAQNAGLLSPHHVKSFIDSIAALPITIDPSSGDHILTDVHRLAIAHRLTSYDAAYLELALRLNLPLSTLDIELIAACKSAAVTLV